MTRLRNPCVDCWLDCNCQAGFELVAARQGECGLTIGYWRTVERPSSTCSTIERDKVCGDGRKKGVKKKKSKMKEAVAACCCCCPAGIYLQSMMFDAFKWDRQVRKSLNLRVPTGSVQGL